MWNALGGEKYQTKHLNKSWDKTMCTLNSVLHHQPVPRESIFSQSGWGMVRCYGVWIEWDSDFMGSQESCYVFVQKHNKNMSHTARSKQADAWRSNEKWMLPGSYPDPKVGAQSVWATFSITPTCGYSLSLSCVLREKWGFKEISGHIYQVDILCLPFR